MNDSSAQRQRHRSTIRGVADVSVPDVVLPDQFFAGDTTGLPESPEKRLMFAVLLDAITQLRHPNRTRVAEVELWIRDSEDANVFSFDNICAVLGLEPRSLASGLLSSGWAARGRAPLRHPRTSRLRVTPRRRRRRAIADDPPAALAVG